MYAEDYLKLNEQPEAIEEAEEVRINDEEIERKKIAESLSTLPTITNQLNLYDRSIKNEIEEANKALERLRADYGASAASATKAIKRLQTDYGASAANAANAFKELSRIAKYYPNYKISRNVSKLNKENKDITSED